MNDAPSFMRAVSRGDDVGPSSAHPCNVAHFIAARVAAKPDGIIRSFAHDGSHRTESYRVLWRRAGDVAAALTAAGATPFSIVVILAEDVVDFLPAFWACLRGGFTAVALTNAAKDFLFRNETAFGVAIKSFDNPFLLVDPFFEGATKLREVFSGPVVPLSSIGLASSWIDHDDVHDTACLVATSGSTGTMKLVALSHATLIFRYGLGADVARAEPWHGIGTFPLDGITGHRATYLPCDSWTQLSSDTVARKPSKILDAIESYDGSIVSLTNSMVNSILAADARDPGMRRLGSLRSVGIGAEPIAVRTMQKLADLLERFGASPDIVRAGYGTTETGALVVGSQAFLQATPRDAVCLGRPVPGVTLRIVDDRGAIIEEGEIGEVEALCPEKLFSGYWGDAELMREAFTADGWWRTRDRGKLIDGQLYLHGRAKDVLILNGKKLSLVDIDAEMHSVLGPGDVAYGCIVTTDQQEALAVGFAVACADTAVPIEQAIKTALARRFGIQPSFLLCIDADAIPKTAGGKIRRDLLSPMIAASSQMDFGPAADDDRNALASIWNIALGRHGPVESDADFFIQGGDSLRSLTLHLQIVDAFSVQIPSDLFFAAPTFGNLLRLVGNRDGAPVARATTDEIPWRLPVRLETNLLAAMETWPGERATPGRTMLTINAKGTRPPLFWVFNDAAEYIALAKQFGNDQPLYAFRSGVAVSDYSEDEIQAFALRYMSDIAAIHPDGPFFIGGNCQGAIIALAIAQHALRRNRHVPLLILMNWAFALQPYLGPVLLIAGCDDARHNASRLFSRPELAWRRAFASFEFVEIPGRHGEYFKPGAIDVVAGCLTSRMLLALWKPLPLMPTRGYLARISVDNIDDTMQAGIPTTIKVVVTNDSEVSWGASDQSGIALGYRWLDQSDAIRFGTMPSTDLPAIAPHASAIVDLTIRPPDDIGEFTLNIELCEEGNRWFAEPSAGFQMSIAIDSSRLPLIEDKLPMRDDRSA